MQILPLLFIFSYVQVIYDKVLFVVAGCLHCSVVLPHLHPGNFCLWNPEFEKFFLVEWRILVFGVRNTAHLESHLRLESRIQVPLTKTGIQYLESGIHDEESRSQARLSWIPLYEASCASPQTQ